MTYKKYMWIKFIENTIILLCIWAISYLLGMEPNVILGIGIGLPLFMLWDHWKYHGKNKLGFKV